MRNIILAVLVLLLAITTPANRYHFVPKPVTKILNRPIAGGLRQFLNRIGKMEGLGNYAAVGGFKNKYLGMYQFHPATLRSLGITAPRDEFLNNPALQDSAMILYMKDNAKDLHSVIKKFNNTYVNGVFVTKSGILAGAHLVGSAGVFAFFYPNKFSYRTTDGNGVNVATYMKKFANYNLGGI